MHGGQRVCLLARGEQRVYNLEVESEHDYFVGPQHLLCHNACPSASGQMESGATSRLSDAYMSANHLVDMEQARSLPESTSNAFGQVRNANYFWTKLIERQPEMFSDGNLFRVQELALSPRVDATWIEYNPTHQSFMGDVLAHHHIDHGPIAVPLPTTVH